VTHSGKQIISAVP